MKKFLLQSVFFIKSSTKLCTKIATYGQKMTKHSWTHLPRQQRDKNINERREIQKRPTILNAERQRGLSHVAPDISIDHPENCPIRMRALNLFYSRFSHSRRPNKDEIYRKNRSYYIIHVVLIYQDGSFFLQQACRYWSWSCSAWWRRQHSSL